MITISTTNNGSVQIKSSANVTTTGASFETPIKYTTHFCGEIEFKNGWQLLWGFKYNQDEADKLLKALYKDLVKALRPRLKDDGLKPTKANVYSYYYTDEFKEYSTKAHEIHTKLGEDNKKFKEFEKMLKENGNW